LCPEASELHEFVNYGIDEKGKIGRHLLSCSSCRSEVDILRPSAEYKEMPYQLWVQGKNFLQSGKIVKGPSRWFRSLFKIPVLAIASAAAVICVLILYPPWIREPVKDLSSSAQETKGVKHDSPLVASGPIVVLSSNTWDPKSLETGLMTPRKESVPEGDSRRVSSRPDPRKGDEALWREREIEMARLLHERSRHVREEASDRRVSLRSERRDTDLVAHRLRVAKVIILNNVEPPFGKEKIRFLYDCIVPEQKLKESFDFIAPRRLEEAEQKGIIKTDSVSKLLEGLRDYLQVPQAVLITISSKGADFDIAAELLDTSTGKVLQERKATGVTENQLPLQIRKLSAMPE
jgi:hypothetical protein